MLTRNWVLFALLALLSFASHAQATEEEDAEGADESPKEVFVPTKFVVPRLSADHSALLWEYFGGRGAIGKTWIKSTAKKDGVDADISKYNGEWEIAAPSEPSIEGDYSLVVKTAARHHAIAAKLARPFDFAPGKPLVVQYEVRFEEGQECGGGYLKLLSQGAEADLAQFNDKTAYTIMFGPDKCSPSGKIHLIFRFRNPKNGSISEHHAKQPDRIDSAYWDDHKTHLYTLKLHEDGSYTVAVDRKQLVKGSMLTDLTPALEPPKEIYDPEDKKPEDWDERAEIEDEKASKPDDWDENAPKEIVDETAEMPSDWLIDEQPLIPDPEAKKPEDWDADIDGEWEPPMVDNPACKAVSGCGEWKRPLKENPNYKGKWRRPKIANPAYKGVWSAKLIPNPDYFEPSKPFEGLAPITAIGIELWTMSKQILFDNILVSESEATAEEAAALTFDVRVAEETRLRTSKGENDGIWQSIVKATDDKPWLYAVYVLAVLVPIVIIAICCFGRQSGSQDDVSYRKKHDVTEEDDEGEEAAPLLVNEAGDEVEEGPEEEQEVQDDVEEKNEVPVEKKKEPRNKSASRSPARSAKKSGRQAIEEDSSGDDGEGATGSQASETEEKKAVEEKAPATKPKRNRPKRAD